MGKLVLPTGEEKAVSDHLDQCQHCQCEELYKKKNFPKWVGLTVVGIAAVLVFVLENYWPLVAAGAIDLGLYFLVPWEVVCYQCGSAYRGVSFAPSIRVFDIAVGDRFKFGERYKGPESTLDD